MFSDKDGEPSVHGFVRIVDRKGVKRIMDEVASKQLKVVDFSDVKIQRAKAPVYRNLDWASYRAEDMFKQHSAAVRKTVVREGGTDSRFRGIYVDGVVPSSKAADTLRGHSIAADVRATRVVVAGSYGTPACHRVVNVENPI